jgi:hypothetical protein
MSLYEALSAYTPRAAVSVVALVLVVFTLRALVLPFALVTVLLDQAQRGLSTVVATVPTRPVEPFATRPGGEER